jgi:hypothetical protein
MPPGVSYTWLSYQLYIVLALLVTRYYDYGNAVTTEAGIANQFRRNARAGDSGVDVDNIAVLSGQERNSPGTIKASLSITYHSRYLEGKARIESLLQPPGGVGIRGPPAIKRESSK